MSLAKDISSPPSEIKVSKHGQSQEATNLNLLDDLIPRSFGIHDLLIPNPMFDLGFVIIFAVEDVVIALSPNGPKCDALKEVLIFNFQCERLLNPSPKSVCFQLKLS